MGQALCDLLRLPDKCRDALRVTLHLVEKSLQRIHRGQKNAMYTTQKSIENKVGQASGWKELLMSVGFRFEPAANGIPTSVFFPQSDPEERLTQCSASLQALLGLSSTSLHALSKLTSNPEAVDDILGVIQQIISQLNSKTLEGNPTPSGQDTSTAEVTIGVRLWRVPGCHELFASLGLDLTDVGQDRVTLRTGKQANKRNVQFVLQALLALFGRGMGYLPLEFVGLFCLVFQIRKKLPKVLVLIPRAVWNPSLPSKTTSPIQITNLNTYSIRLGVPGYRYQWLGPSSQENGTSLVFLLMWLQNWFFQIG